MTHRILRAAVVFPKSGTAMYMENEKKTYSIRPMEQRTDGCMKH